MRPDRPWVVIDHWISVLVNGIRKQYQRPQCAPSQKREPATMVKIWLYLTSSLSLLIIGSESATMTMTRRRAEDMRLWRIRNTIRFPHLLSKWACYNGSQIRTLSLSGILHTLLLRVPEISVRIGYGTSFMA